MDYADKKFIVECQTQSYSCWCVPACAAHGEPQIRSVMVKRKKKCCVTHLVLGAAASSHVGMMEFYCEIIYDKITQKPGNNYRKCIFLGSKRAENLFFVMFNVHETLIPPC